MSSITFVYAAQPAASCDQQCNRQCVLGHLQIMRPKQIKFLFVAWII